METSSVTKCSACDGKGWVTGFDGIDASHGNLCQVMCDRCEGKGGLKICTECQGRGAHYVAGWWDRACKTCDGKQYEPAELPE